MKPTDCLKLENDNSFKGKYLRMTTWWKTPLVIAPILILFTGIVGLIFCLRSDLLLSLYAVPYIIIFLLGTIWFKGLKRHIFKSKLNDVQAFKVCISKTFTIKDGYTYLLFTKESKRHNDHFTNKILSDIPKEDINLSKIKNGSVSHVIDLDGVEILMTKISNGKLKKSIANIDSNSSIPLIYIDDKNIFVILKRDQTNL